MLAAPLLLTTRPTSQTSGIARTIVPDSAKIFSYLDTAVPLDAEHQFTADKSEAYASLQTAASADFAAYVRYYNWIYTPTWSITMKKRLSRLLPLQAVRTQSLLFSLAHSLKSLPSLSLPR